MTFSANSFASAFGQSAPVDPVTGSFRITFDNTKTYVSDTADIHIQTLNIDLGSLLAFTFSPSGVMGQSSPDELVVGGLQDDPAHVQFSPASNDFWLFIQNVSTAATFDQVGYSQTSVNGDNLFFTNDHTGSIGVTPVIPSGVPEPSTWAMMLLGFAGFGYASFRRTSKPRLA